MVTERLAVVSSGVWVDGEVFIKTARGAAGVEAVNANGGHCPVDGDGEDNRREGLGLVGYVARE